MLSVFLLFLVEVSLFLYFISFISKKNSLKKISKSVNLVNNFFKKSMFDSTYEGISGFDIGTENCTIGQYCLNGIELIHDEFNYFNTPNYVKFFYEKREIGSKAKNYLHENIKSTFFNIKRLIGRSYEDVIKNEEIFFPMEDGINGKILMPVVIFGEEHLLTPTQLLAMIFTKLKSISNASECVVSCPNFFTDHQRRELINAAKIANLKVLRLVPDLTALALDYCYKRFNYENENNEIVAFVDIGASSTQCSIINYDLKNKFFKVLVVEYDSKLGGNDITKALANDFITTHQLNSYKFSKLHLISKCEEMKKKFLDDFSTQSFTIKNFYNDKDLTFSMNFKKFSEICENYFLKIETVLHRALNKFNTLDKNDLGLNSNIQVVNVSGGFLKMPLIRDRIKNVFNVAGLQNFIFKKENTNNNIYYGCTLESCSFYKNTLKDYKINFQDYQPFEINGTAYNRFNPNLKKYFLNSIFKKGCAVPSVAEVKIDCQELPMVFDFNYIDDKNISNEFLKLKVFSKEKLVFTKSQLSLKIRLDESGLLKFFSGQLEIEEDCEKDLTNQFENNGKTLKIISLDHEIINLKGNLSDEKLKDFCNFESRFSEIEISQQENSKTNLKDFIVIWKNNIEKEEFSKYLEKDVIDSYSKELENIDKQISADEANNHLQSTLFYNRRLTFLSKFSDKIIDATRKTDIKRTIYFNTTSLIQQTNHNTNNFNNICKFKFIQYFHKEVKSFIEDSQEWFNNNLADLERNKFIKDIEYSYKTCLDNLNELKNCFDVFEKKYENEIFIKLEWKLVTNGSSSLITL